MPRVDGGPVETDPRKIWRRFAENFHLFRGTPSWLWLNHAFTEVFGFRERLSGRQRRPRLRPHRRLPGAARIPPARPVRALQHRGADDDREPARRPQTSPQDQGERLEGPRADRVPPRSRGRSRPFPASSTTSPRSAASPTPTSRPCKGYLAALRQAAAPIFKSVGCTSTDHGHPTARTADLPPREAAALYDRVRKGGASRRRRRTVPRPDADRDGAHEPRGRARHADPSRLVPRPQSLASSRPSASDKGADIPTPTDYVHALKPLLDRFGNEREPDDHPVHPRRDRLFARARAARRPLSGAEARAGRGGSSTARRACGAIARASPRPRASTTPSASTTTRAPSCRSRRATTCARRVDCAYLARLVAEHRLELDEALRGRARSRLSARQSGLQAVRNRSQFSALARGAGDWSMAYSSRNVSGVIASEAKQSRLGVCRCGFVWIASLSLAMTVDRKSIPKQSPQISARRPIQQRRTLIA